MSIDNSTGKTKGFYERGQAIFDRIPKGEEMKMSKPEVNHMNLIDLEALVLHHGQQIRDIAEHLLELRKWGSPMMEFKQEKPTKICGPDLVGILNAAGFYQKKKWVGLTDEEMKNLFDAEIERKHSDWLVFARAIETKLKEKNGG